MEHYFYGIVEDRQDPLMIGRVRVRIHGIHTDNKQLIATPDLPWCQVILPTTAAGLSGIGTQHGLVEGSTVFGYFRDGDLKQDPIILGTTAGIPQVGYKESVTDELITRATDRGFNDPRKLTVEDYNDTSDGPNPKQDVRRGFGLTSALDTAPKEPKTIDIKYDATGSTIEETELTEDDLPFYPLYTDQSDLSSFARGVSKEGTLYEHKLSDNLEGFLDSAEAPVYPYNKVTATESGHLIEVDDTPTAERLNIHHRSGTFHEIHPDGSEVSRIVNDHYQVICKDESIFIAGNADIIVEKGNVTINVNTGNVTTNVLKGDMTTTVSEGNVLTTVSKGNVNLDVTEGNVDAQIGGTLNADVVGNTTFTSPTTKMTTNLTVDGTVHITGKQTNDKTIHATGDISTSAGNGPTLATHYHKTKSMDTGSGANAGKTNKSERPGPGSAPTDFPVVPAEE